MSQFFKSKILEFLTRKILFNCGFSSVRSDQLYIFDRHPLQMINGKGAAHDADVLMNPPIQMPFTYPTRLIFECKAYARSRKVGVDIVRNALGFRNDINDFEIITEDFLRDRQNNRRIMLAVSKRKRHYYQVGISTLFDFSKPALEFAANNKIPLLSFSELFAGTGLVEAIDAIPHNIDVLIGAEAYQVLLTGLSKKDVHNLESGIIGRAINDNETLRRCFEIINSEILKVYVGILESGEIIFLRRDSVDTNEDILSNNYTGLLTAQIRWRDGNRERWEIRFNGSPTPYYFYLPKEIAKSWKAYNDVRAGALELKQQNFARFFIFNKGSDNMGYPFKLVTLDNEWLRSFIE